MCCGIYSEKDLRRPLNNQFFALVWLIFHLRRPILNDKINLKQRNNLFKRKLKWKDYLPNELRKSVIFFILIVITSMYSLFCQSCWICF